MREASSTDPNVLALIPTAAHRICVLDEYGRQKYRRPDELLDTDKILLTDAGVPVVMKHAPGRARKVELPAKTTELGVVGKRRRESVADDDLLNAVVTNPEKPEVLDLVIQGLAEEAAVLAFERTEAERNGTDISQLSMRRVNTLKAVGDTWLKRKEQIANNGVDMDSPAFKKLFQFISNTFRAALASSGLRDEVIEMVFSQFGKKLDDDWRREAIKRMTDS